MQINNLVLPNPNWSDEQKTGGSLHVHTAMGGQTYTYVIKKTTKLLSFTLSGVKYDKLMELRNLIQANTGVEVTLIDWYNQTWIGYILTNPNTITLEGRYRCLDGVHREVGSVTIEFEGEIQ